MIKDTTEDPCDRDDRNPRERLLGKAKARHRHDPPCCGSQIGAVNSCRAN